MPEPTTTDLAGMTGALTDAFGMPEVALPWIDRFLEPDEMALVRALSGGPLPLPEVAARLPRPMGISFFERAVRRGVANLPTATTMSLASFGDRFDVWALFEGWRDVPEEVRTGLREWSLERYVEDRRAQIDALKAGERPWPPLQNAEYLLLDEAERLLARVEHIYLRPCDCRAIMEQCGKPKNVCLVFENVRGLGWEISLERALDVLHEADDAGLMHTSESEAADSLVLAAAGDAGDGAVHADFSTPITSGALCNCCSDCCFPQLGSARLGATRLWPRRRHVATLDRGSCTACGRCVKRCPFGAFSWGEGAPKSRRAGREATDSRIDPESCRGCGLCATGCPAGSVTMRPLAQDRGLASF